MSEKILLTRQYVTEVFKIGKIEEILQSQQDIEIEHDSDLSKAFNEARNSLTMYKMKLNTLVNELIDPDPEIIKHHKDTMIDVIERLDEFFEDRQN